MAYTGEDVPSIPDFVLSGVAVDQGQAVLYLGCPRSRMKMVMGPSSFLRGFLNQLFVFISQSLALVGKEGSLKLYVGLGVEGS